MLTSPTDLRKILIGPRLRQIRRETGETQAQMARRLGVSASYVNLLESNQRSLSVKMLIRLTEVYGVDLSEIVQTEPDQRLAELRAVTKDPVLSGAAPDIQELRGAIDHAPRLVEQMLELHKAYRALADRVLKSGSESASELAALSPETALHDFFRDQGNHFAALEDAAAAELRAGPIEPDGAFAVLKTRLERQHGIKVQSATVDALQHTLRAFDTGARVLTLSEALDHQNRVFQLAHVLGLVAHAEVIDSIVAGSGLTASRHGARLRIELANYFAAAVLMPYGPFLAAAEDERYDIDLLAARFGVSFEQVCHRLTTLQREGARGVPFFFLRVDRAGNVTKRFNATAFHLAEYGGSCPRWNLHDTFRTPDVIHPQFVELPDGARFFTISRTTNRPTFSRRTQDRRLAVALGCSMSEAHRIVYSDPFNLSDEVLLTQIGINCHLCPRQACADRAHQPMHIDLPIDANRRGSTRYES